MVRDLIDPHHLVFTCRLRQQQMRRQTVTIARQSHATFPTYLIVTVVTYSILPCLKACLCTRIKSARRLDAFSCFLPGRISEELLLENIARVVPLLFRERFKAGAQQRDRYKRAVVPGNYRNSSKTYITSGMRGLY